MKKEYQKELEGKITECLDCADEKDRNAICQKTFISFFQAAEDLKILCCFLENNLGKISTKEIALLMLGKRIIEKMEEDINNKAKEFLRIDKLYFS